MKRRKGWLLTGLAMWLVSASCGGTECRFFRIECLDGEAPENLAITMDESGQTFLEFDTVEGNSYSIEATDSLSPPAWSAVWSLTGNGQRATWLTTARRWSRTFGGGADDMARSVRQTHDGGYILAGSTRSFGAGEEDVYLIKIGADGNEGWSKTFGGTRGDEAWSVQQTTDGGYIVAGRNSSVRRDGDVYLMKTDANGSEVWSKTFGGTDSDGGFSVQQTSDGGYIVAGVTESFGEGWDDVYLIKTDADGNEGWSRTFGGLGRELLSSVQQTSDGGYILAGFSNSFGTGESDWDAYVIKTDGNGREVWSRIFGGDWNQYSHSAQETSDGGSIVAGTTCTFGAGPFDIFLIKTDADGNEAWSRTFGGKAMDEGYSVQQTTDGGYVVAGNTDSFGAGDGDVYLIKTDADGNEVWSRTFGGTDVDYGNSVQQTSDGGYVVAGITWSFGAGAWDVYLIKTDQNGNAPPPEPRFISVVVSGPGEVEENSSADFTATAHWDDGSTQDVTNAALWLPESGNHYFSTPGHLVTGEVTSDESLSLSAAYEGLTGVKDITVKNVALVTSVTLSGPDEVDENSSDDYTATAHWDDGSNEDVTDSASWSPDSGNHYFSSPGHLITGDVSSDEPLTLSASFGGQTGVKDITVNNVPIFTSVTISGPDEVDENSSADYTATAHWDDGSTQDVTSSALWLPDSGNHHFSTPGHLVTGEVTADEPITVFAVYQGKSGSKGVTVRQI